MTQALLLALAGFLGQAMNGLAGGGSFVTLPALIAAGVPAVSANASSTLALFPGGLASAWTYHRGGSHQVCGIPLPMLALATGIGGLVGSLALLVTPARTFDTILPWLLLIAFLALAFAKPLGAAFRRGVQLPRLALVGVQFVLGFYGGYFGGAAGTLMVAVWGLFDPADLRILNAPRTLMVSAANAAAVVCFTLAGAVSWPQTSAMLAGGVVGGFAGALAGRRHAMTAASIRMRARSAPWPARGFPGRPPASTRYRSCPS
jgi:uncharacterized membrane protein YfcA